MDENVDVMVVGGGVAGIAAAVMAARMGARTSLVEAQDIPGGMATLAGVGTICGLFLRSEHGHPTFVADGFMREFAERLMKRSNKKPLHGKKGLIFLPYEPVDFIAVSQGILSEAGVETHYRSKVQAVHLAGSVVLAIDVQDQKAMRRCHPVTIIDASGGPLLARLMGEKQILEDEEYQAGARVFRLGNIQVENEFHLNLHIGKAIQEAQQSQLISPILSRLSLIPGSLHAGQARFKLGVSVEEMIKGHVRSHIDNRSAEWVRLWVDLLKKLSPAFSRVELLDMAPHTGIRTEPRYRGRTVLEKEDVTHCHKSPFSAARGCWPIEFWPPGEQVIMTYFQEQDYYDIPASCLQHPSLQNLIFAGRNISADKDAIASARVMGTCLQMGESAGRMAVEFIQEKQQ